MLFYFGLLLKKEMTAFMPIEDKVTTSLTILITGFVVVFAVLLLLILLISLYGKIVSSALNSKAEKKTVVNVETPKTEVIPANVPFFLTFENRLIRELNAHFLFCSKFIHTNRAVIAPKSVPPQ